MLPSPRRPHGGRGCRDTSAMARSALAPSGEECGNRSAEIDRQYIGSRGETVSTRCPRLPPAPAGLWRARHRVGAVHWGGGGGFREGVSRVGRIVTHLLWTSSFSFLFPVLFDCSSFTFENHLISCRSASAAAAHNTQPYRINTIRFPGLSRWKIKGRVLLILMQSNVIKPPTKGRRGRCRPCHHRVCSHTAAATAPPHPL